MRQRDVGEFWRKLADACNAVDLKRYVRDVDAVVDACGVEFTAPFCKRCGMKWYSETRCRHCNKRV